MYLSLILSIGFFLMVIKYVCPFFFFFLNVYLGRFPCLSAGVYKRFGLTRNSVGGVTGSHAGHRDEFFFFFFFFLDQGGDGRFE